MIRVEVAADAEISMIKIRPSWLISCQNALCVPKKKRVEHKSYQMTRACMCTYVRALEVAVTFEENVKPPRWCPFVQLTMFAFSHNFEMFAYTVLHEFAAS